MGFSRQLVALLLLTLIGSLPALAFGQPGLADFIIENPADPQPIYPWGKGRLASLGELSGFFYRTAPDRDWFYLHDTQGNESHIHLPDRYTKNDRANAEYILTSPNHLWLWSGIIGASTLRHYRLDGSGALPSAATLLSATRIGDLNSRPGGLIRLASGGFLGVWYQFEYHAEQQLAIGLLYGHPDGRVTTLFPLQAEGKEGNIVGTRWTLAQHPADGSVWIFFKRDSYHEISAIHVTETGADIRVDWIDTDYISEPDGLHAPESEYPYLIAAPDLKRKTLRLAYQNREYEMFYVADKAGRFVKGRCAPPKTGQLEPAFFSKGAAISVAEIKADGSRAFSRFPYYANATRYFGFSVSGKLWLAFQPVDCSITSFAELQKSGRIYLSHYAGGWSPPALLGQWDENKDYYSSPILYNTSRPEFIMRLSDGKVHNFEGF